MGRRFAIGSFWLAALLVCHVPAAAADTVPVTSNADPGPGTLRSALATVSSGGTIVVQPGIGEITLQSALPPITKSLTIEGAGPSDTLVNGNAKGRVFDIQGPGVAVTISGVGFTGGLVAAPGGTGAGGGILVHNASLTLSNSLVDANKVDTTGSGAGNGGTSQGGGIAADTATSSLTLLNTLVSDNRALAGAGGTGRGGVAQGGGIYDAGTLVMHGGALDGNTADSSSPGGFFGDAFGGGLAYAGDSTTSATIDGSRVSGNAVKTDGTGSGASGGEADAGGIGAFDLGGSATISNATISGNSNSANGGANGAGGVADGGGADLIGRGSLTNVTVTGNSAAANGQGAGGGGIADAGGLRTAFQTNSVVNTTFAANTGSAAGSGGVAAGNVTGGSEPLHFKNSIVTAGVGTTTANCSNTSTFVSDGHNIDSLDQCAFHATGDHVHTDPLLGSLHDNGGPVETLALNPGSAAIDAGDNTGCPPTDARGVLRPAGPACDIGAFEVPTPGAVTDAATGVGLVAATLNGTATNPDLAGGSVVFQYGTTPAYGSSSAAQGIGATTAPRPFNTTIGGLSPATTYHFREVVTNAIGTAFGADRTFTTAAPPSPLFPALLAHLSGASQSHSLWRRGSQLITISRRRPPVGTTFKFSLDVPATVRFDFTQLASGRKVNGRCVAPNRRNRRKRGCKRSVVRATFSFAGHAGLNSVRFAGRVSSTKTLKPGKYTLVITTPGDGSTSQKLTFTIAK